MPICAWAPGRRARRLGRPFPVTSVIRSNGLVGASRRCGTVLRCGPPSRTSASAATVWYTKTSRTSSGVRRRAARRRAPRPAASRRRRRRSLSSTPDPRQAEHLAPNHGHGRSSARSAGRRIRPARFEVPRSGRAGPAVQFAGRRSAESGPCGRKPRGPCSRAARRQGRYAGAAGVRRRRRRPADVSQARVSSRTTTASRTPGCAASAASISPSSMR